MKYKYVSCILIVLAICIQTGCGGRKSNDMLARVDSLISMGKDETALTILSQIKDKGLKDEGDIAYYNLLMTQVRYRLYLPPLQDSTMMDRSIEYFKGKDEEKLTRSYYYKGVTDEERGNVKSAILNLKNAENQIKDIDNKELKNKILGSIAFINYRNNENFLAVEYGKKYLQLSKKNKDTANIAFALDVIAIAYEGLGKEDSADYYMTQIVPYLTSIQEKERAALLNNIYAQSGNLAVDKTIGYLKESCRIDSNSTACSNLARYYYKMGMNEESDKMWEKAMEETDLNLLIKYTRGLIKQRTDEGRYKEVGELSKKLLVLSDSLKHKQQEESIRDLQAEYDSRMAKERTESRIRFWTCLMVIFLLVVALVAIYNKVKAEKARAQLMEENMHAQALKDKIEKLERENARSKEKEKIIEDMKRALAKLNEKHAMTLASGRKLYEHINGGGNTLKWKKSDFVDYIDYYWSVDMAFVSEMRMNYGDLSPRYQFFMILQHLDTSEDEIMRIMCIGKSSFRSIRSRTNQSKVGSR